MADVDYVMLEYERRSELTDGEHLHDGVVIVKEGENTTGTPFVGFPYHQMITRFAAAAREHADKKVMFMRRDQKPRPMAIEMEPSMVNLLRTDPVMYIRSTSPPPQHITLKLGDDVKVEDRVAAQPIPAGQDTLADAFGDAVYVRMRRGGCSECPGCGRWKSTTSTDQDLNGFLRCECGFVAVVKAYPTETGGWVGIHVGELLQVMEKRLLSQVFLPRLWNSGGSWISYENLKQRYERFCKERDDVQRSTETSRRQDS